MILKTSSYHIEIIDEPTYTPGSVDNIRSYAKEYFLPSRQDVYTRYGVIISNPDGIKQNSVFIGTSGFSSIHETSALVQDDKLFLAIGNQVCSLSLPDLNHIWYKQVDPSACFEIYYSAEFQCLISHGELEIARLTLNGEIIWSVSGKDIFTQGFTLHSDHIDVVDFNYERYRIEISTGTIRLI